MLILRPDYNEVMAERMRLRGWDQYDVADRTGLYVEQIEQMLTGVYRPNREQGRKIERALDVEIYRDDGFPPETREENAVDPEFDFGGGGR